MRREILLTGLLLCILTAGYAQNGKRGLAYGHHSPEDLDVLSPEISWWYNWAVTPENSVADVYGDYGFEFVPMAWNDQFNETALRNFLDDHPDVRYLLAFNEPNFLEQANMTPSEAAAAWPQLEAIADDYDLILVGPAVNFCGSCVEEGGVTYTSPFDYLDDFFEACPDCRVDHIAVHCYMNTVSALEWYMGEFKKYGKPIWLTEFAGWESNGNINNADDQINYMIGAVDYLESNPDIFRYAWFIGRGPGINNYPYIDILGDNGELTPIGEVYKQMPVHDTSVIVEIPARIEAEAYNRMDGILIEKTADGSGFANVGYIDAGDWLEYRIRVPEADTFDIRFRVASTRSSQLEVLIDSVVTLTQSFTNTGGWQNWQYFDNTIALDSGEHTLLIRAVTDGFNINWFQIAKGILGTETFRNHPADLTVSPNPGNGLLKIQTTEKFSKVQVFSISGEKLLDVPFSAELDLQYLDPGMYFLRFISPEENYYVSRKISVF